MGSKCEILRASRCFLRRLQTQTLFNAAGTSHLCHKRTKDRLRSYFGLRGNGINPSRFGILTLGSDCASITSFDPTIPLRLRI